MKKLSLIVFALLTASLAANAQEQFGVRGSSFGGSRGGPPNTPSPSPAGRSSAPLGSVGNPMVTVPLAEARMRARSADRPTRTRVQEKSESLSQNYKITLYYITGEFHDAAHR